MWFSRTQIFHVPRASVNKQPVWTKLGGQQLEQRAVTPFGTTEQWCANRERALLNHRRQSFYYLVLGQDGQWCAAARATPHAESGVKQPQEGVKTRGRGQCRERVAVEKVLTHRNRRAEACYGTDFYRR